MLIQRYGEQANGGRTYGRSIPRVLASLTDMLLRAQVPLVLVLAWSACLLFTIPM